MGACAALQESKAHDGNFYYISALSYHVSQEELEESPSENSEGLRKRGNAFVSLEELGLNSSKIHTNHIDELTSGMKDPLVWFTALPPPDLRKSQFKFKEGNVL